MKPENRLRATMDYINNLIEKNEHASIVDLKIIWNDLSDVVTEMESKTKNDHGDGIPIPDSDYDRKIGPMSNWNTKGGWGLENEDPMDDGGFKHFQD